MTRYQIIEVPQHAECGGVCHEAAVFGLLPHAVGTLTKPSFDKPEYVKTMERLHTGTLCSRWDD